ncbi:MAG: hypothetical protein ACFFDQ_11260 [Candidatus Thorarchaeota archaeon]
MRFNVPVLLICLIIILASMTSIANADTEIVITGDEEILTSAVFGNMTTPQLNEEQIMGLSVTDDGRMFTVSHQGMWQERDDPTEVSLIAWGSDGAVLWFQVTTHFDKVYYDVTNDGSFVYVAGFKDGDILVEKFDFDGNQVWNCTLDFGQTEIGYEIRVMGDGTIIIGGEQEVEDPESSQCFLLALNQTGQTQWYYEWGSYPSYLCDSNYLYVWKIGNTGNRFEKWESNGSVVWSDDCDSEFERFIGLTDDFVYTFSLEQMHLAWNQPWQIFWHSEVKITTWHSETGVAVNSSRLKVFNDEHQLFNETWVSTGVDQEGGVWILMRPSGVINSYGVYFLISYNLETESTSIHKVLEHHLSRVLFEMDDFGNAYIASTSNLYGYFVMKYDSSQLNPSTSTSTPTTRTQTVTYGFYNLMDWQVVSLVIIGVAIFDTIVILYFKRKAAD